ncbi:hypothetical protein FDC58_18310 [Clostridium botulinum]|uniref:hypothetical protein n=1 Tax=Clostridium TaxID=1485 RepID=UPI000CF68C2D|nr:MULTISPECIES: hypothetical protein [Clostridium]MBY6801964.1 hypothetical protein [Clostridium botulinum]MBY6812104.1 hypothetical protein [Clostridium botulinum]MBY7007721.1 hypothetical protein [Clostridium botulinum]MBZ9692910.1 hypothetical protein [Clostridium sp. M14]NFG41586.1 hypothetical protein [Clostridium botulinum]
MKIEKINLLCKYSMRVEDDKFIIKGDGLFSKNDAEGYLELFQKTIKSIDSNNLILIIDNSQFRMSFPDTKLFYEKVCNAYINSNFKDKYIVMPENDIANIQIKKNANKIFNYIKVISDINIIK